MGLKNITQTQNTMASSIKVGDVHGVIFFFFVKVVFTINFQLVAIMSTNSTTLSHKMSVTGSEKKGAQFKDGEKMDVPP